VIDRLLCVYVCVRACLCAQVGLVFRGEMGDTKVRTSLVSMQARVVRV